MPGGTGGHLLQEQAQPYFLGVASASNGSSTIPGQRPIRVRAAKHTAVSRRDGQEPAVCNSPNGRVQIERCRAERIDLDHVEGPKFVHPHGVLTAHLNAVFEPVVLRIPLYVPHCIRVAVVRHDALHAIRELEGVAQGPKPRRREGVEDTQSCISGLRLDAAIRCLGFLLPKLREGSKRHHRKVSVEDHHRVVEGLLKRRALLLVRQDHG
mmetsp:Transcript_41152/g.89909  ORF Transcript_41152/g.89909 Transcript_41152/m.89909 type:complete len:210 (-) Transcript_41152:208-837(-)